MAKAKKKTPTPKKSPRFGFLKQNLLPIGLSVLLFILLIIAYQVIMSDKFYPLTFVGNINVSFLTEGRAIQVVDSTFRQRSRQKLEFYFPQGLFTVDLATASASLDYSEMDISYKTSHVNWFTFFSNTKINPKITLNLDQQLNNLALLVDQKPQNAKLIFDETPNSESTASSRIQLTASRDGFALDKDEIIKAITNYLLSGKYQSAVPLKIVHPKVTTGYVTRAKQALEEVQNQPIKLTFENKTWTIDLKQLLTLLDLEQGQDSLVDKNKTYLFLDKIGSEINREVSEGLFEFNPTSKRVTAFRAAQEGRTLNKDQAYQLIIEAVASSSAKALTLPVDIVKPKIETADVNSLGIKELLGRGISNFAGSIPNRIYNIGLAASRVNGVLVPPGQTFSFNQTVGDITAQTGFKQAYVIKEGRTVLDDGGGVCQDSTTLFRAVLNAGLPVVARTAHAYRVGYYEQGFPPGLDATVFYPSVDFQFKNDTPAHILIQAYTSGNTVYFDLYGTPDDRTVTLTKPVITNQTPPPAELRQDDPTLPKGTVKQVDFAAWGATVTFKRTVIKNGETILNETWRSNFKPWQAVYLVGTQ
ncbi:VanW family protein [Patescibacteria group bacterium]|nr:VanW family protein [Patescibacteria group bacterium]